MRCPFCEHDDTKVIDSRHTEDGHAIRRRRECDGCGKRFTTYEKIEQMILMVIKKDGSSFLAKMGLSMSMMGFTVSTSWSLTAATSILKPSFFSVSGASTAGASTTTGATGSWMGAASATGAAASITEPQLMQNLASGASSAPHLVQNINVSPFKLDLQEKYIIITDKCQ